MAAGRGVSGGSASTSESSGTTRHEAPEAEARTPGGSLGRSFARDIDEDSLMPLEDARRGWKAVLAATSGKSTDDYYHYDSVIEEIQAV